MGLAGVGMHCFDLVLGGGDRTGHPGMLGGLDLEAVHQPSNTICRRTEDLHQVVFERDEEPARARVALTAGAAAQLIVDPPTFVPLGADDVQAAHASHALAEGDVTTSSSHVGADRYVARLTGLCDDS